MRSSFWVLSAASPRKARPTSNRWSIWSRPFLIHTAADGLELIERVGKENFGLLLDTFHMNIEDADIGDSIRTCGDRIFHFHVADSNRWHPGAGHLDFGSILERLEKTGYQGFVSGEFMPLPDADTAAERGIAHLISL